MSDSGSERHSLISDGSTIAQPEPPAYTDDEVMILLFTHISRLGGNTHPAQIAL